MNILLVTHIFPPAIDGGSRVIFKLGEYLNDDNHTVKCLTSDCSSTDDFVNPLSYSSIQDNQNLFQVWRLPVYKNFRRPLKFLCLFLPKNAYLRQLGEVFQKGPIFKFIPFIKALIQIYRFHPDLVIAGPLPTTSVVYAKIISEICKSKLLINASFHQTDNDFYKKPLVNCLKSADYIWSLSEYENHFFQTHFLIPSEKIITVGNGVDKKMIISPNNINYPVERNILFVGSLAAHKNLDILIKAFADIAHKQDNLNLIIAGQKTLYSQNLENQVKKLSPSICKRISFKFSFPEEKLTDFIDSSSVLVLPSSQESFGLVLIEAMARGKPFIVSDIPPLEEMCKKTKGGITFKNGSYKDLSLKLQLILDRPKLYRQMGQSGLDYVNKHYTWDRIGKQICKKIL